MLTDLGLPFGVQASFAKDINSSGQIVGDSYGPDKAILWQDGKAIELFPGAVSSGAKGINDSGQIIGFYRFPGGSAHNFIWLDGNVTDLTTLIGSPSIVHDINNLGQVTGAFQNENGSYRAFLWDNNSFINLGTLGGNLSTGLAINDLGHVVGRSIPANSISFHGFFWRDGIMEDVGTLGGSTDAFGINNRDQVVGETRLANGLSRAFLWQNGQLVDLNDRIARNSGWTLQQAHDINDRGEITGRGLLGNDNRGRGFILRPITP